MPAQLSDLTILCQLKRCQGEEFPCFQTLNTNAAPLFKKDTGQASVSPNTEIEGQEDDTITSVKDKEVRQIRTREWSYEETT